jgi:polar amino acid transport system substrate-binding protein
MRQAGRVLLTLLLLAGLVAGCAETTKTAAPPSPAPILSQILARGELVVGTAADMPPLNMTTKDGKVIGLEPDLARFMAEAMGVKLTLKPIAFPNLMSALEQRQVDMVLSGMTITGQRNMKVAFVGPYISTGKSFLTKSETLAAVTEATEVNSPDTTLVTLRNSTSQQFVETVLPKAKLTLVNTYDEGVKMVLEDKVKAMVADYPICVISVFRYPDKGLASLVTPLTYEPIGVAMPAGDALLVNWVQNYLSTAEMTGTLERLKAKWFKDASWLTQLP